jgi:hypothetical protein
MKGLDKFGRTLLFLVFLVMFVQGARLGLKAVNPQIRKVSPSLADTLAAIP